MTTTMHIYQGATMPRPHVHALRPRLVALTIAMIVTAACSDAHANSGAATGKATHNAPAARQRIAIEERWHAGSEGTFALIPLSPGPIKADSGTFTFPDAASTVTIKDGQTVTTYDGIDTLDGRHGTLTIPNTQGFTDAGSNYQTSTGTWSIRHGTDTYRLVHGSGRACTVATPNGTVLTRYEGYVRTS